VPSTSFRMTGGLLAHGVGLSKYIEEIWTGALDSCCDIMNICEEEVSAASRARKSVERNNLAVVIVERLGSLLVPPKARDTHRLTPYHRNRPIRRAVVGDFTTFGSYVHVRDMI